MGKVQDAINAREEARAPQAPARRAAPRKSKPKVYTEEDAARHLEGAPE